MTFRSIVTAAAATVLLAYPSSAQAPASFMVISPVYSQLVAFSIPSNFVAGAEKNDGTTYTREAVPKGETVDKWNEMITVTGAKGLASQPNASAEKFAGVIATGFKNACPDSFDLKLLGANAATFAVVVGCGKIGEATKRSETTLIISIKGSADLYTVQWSERGKPADKADVNNAKWAERLQKLAPLRVCPIVPGEAPPYPSCVGKP
jgi:hypothetical protein